MGVGECAGEVVPLVEMGLAASEREVFEAQILLDEGKPGEAASRAFSAMLVAARALTRQKNENLSDQAGRGRERVQARTSSTPSCSGITYAHGKFAQYFFKAYEEPRQEPDHERRRTCWWKRRSCSSTRRTSATRRPAIWRARLSLRASRQMKSEKLQIKFFARPNAARSTLEAVVPVFHRFIREHAVRRADDRRRRLQARQSRSGRCAGG